MDHQTRFGLGNALLNSRFQLKFSVSGRADQSDPVIDLSAQARPPSRSGTCRQRKKEEQDRKNTVLILGNFSSVLKFICCIVM